MHIIPAFHSGRSFRKRDAYAKRRGSCWASTPWRVRGSSASTSCCGDPKAGGWGSWGWGMGGVRGWGVGDDKMVIFGNVFDRF